MSEFLPDGLYPFVDERLPLSELGMMEAPTELKALLLRAAIENEIEIVRDRPAEIRCAVAGFPDATFLVF